MLKLQCPWCGSRNEDEFTYGDPADLRRPAAPSSLSDAEWANYLFLRDNVRGETSELWRHTFGCRQWFVADRDTLSNRVIDTRPLPATVRSE